MLWVTAQEKGNQSEKSTRPTFSATLPQNESAHFTNRRCLSWFDSEITGEFRANWPHILYLYMDIHTWLCVVSMINDYLSQIIYCALSCFSFRESVVWSVIPAICWHRDRTERCRAVRQKLRIPGPLYLPSRLRVSGIPERTLAITLPFAVLKYPVVALGWLDGIHTYVQNIVRPDCRIPGSSVFHDISPCRDSEKKTPRIDRSSWWHILYLLWDYDRVSGQHIL